MFTKEELEQITTLCDAAEKLERMLHAIGLNIPARDRMIALSIGERCKALIAEIEKAEKEKAEK